MISCKAGTGNGYDFSKVYKPDGVEPTLACRQLTGHRAGLIRYLAEPNTSPLRGGLQPS